MWTWNSKKNWRLHIKNERLILGLFNVILGWAEIYALHVWNFENENTLNNLESTQRHIRMNQRWLISQVIDLLPQK